MASTQRLDGVAELKDKFRQLKDGMQKRTARRMVASAGRTVVGTAKQIARSLGLVKSGALVRNIVQKRDPAAGAGTEQYNVGVRHGRNLTKKQKSTATLAVNKDGRIVKKYENDPFYWRFLELDKKGRTGTPFIGPALEQNPGAAIEAMERTLDADLQKL
jgi:HK97 gp10 family phage protein